MSNTYRIDLTGNEYGRLTVVSLAGTYRRPCGAADGRLWNCRCQCGNETVAHGGNLRKGITTSCGCYQKEQSGKSTARRNVANATHGMYRTAEYRTWRDMRQRCTNRRNRKYPDYGGRGIKVCERWESFENFLADMGRRPPGRMSLDRINNDGDYEPGNCRWATYSVQNANRRRVNVQHENGLED